MSKINYRVCDGCNLELETDIRLTGFTNGYRIYNRLFNGIDICDECMKKIKNLSKDIDKEKKIFKKIHKKASQYNNIDNRSAYYEGVEDVLEILSNKELLKMYNKNVKE